MPRSVAMALTGHQSEEVYRGYDIVSERDPRDAVRKAALARLGHKLRPQPADEAGKMGWMTGLEPATPGATVQGPSAPKNTDNKIADSESEAGASG